MKSKEEFKTFVQAHPELIKYVKSGESSWQKFYELYSLYDENNEAWDTYLRNEKNYTNDYQNRTSTNPSMSDLFNSLKSIKPEVLQQNITSIQKFLGFISEFVGDKGTKPTTKNIYTPRPTNKMFED